MEQIFRWLGNSQSDRTLLERTRGNSSMQSRPISRMETSECTTQSPIRSMSRHRPDLHLPSETQQISSATARLIFHTSLSKGAIGFSRPLLGTTRIQKSRRAIAPPPKLIRTSQRGSQLVSGNQQPCQGNSFSLRVIKETLLASIQMEMLKSSLSPATAVVL